MSTEPEAIPEATVDDEQQWILPRPFEILNHLSDDHKWEVTRRHPYYQAFWRIARGVDLTSIPPESTDLARLILGLVGVQGEYPPPGTPFNDLVQNAVARAWTQGAIARVSVRQLLMMLVRILPKEAKESVANALASTAHIDLHDQASFYNSLRAIKDSSEPSFDLMLPGLIFTVNPHASDKAITDAITEVVKQFRQEHQIPSTRRREDRLDEYLKVWDLREGWNGEQYDFQLRKSLQEVSRELKLSISTAGNHYYSAFRFIIGHTYRADRYFQTMGILGIQDWFSGAIRRPMNPRSHRHVTKTTLAFKKTLLDGRAETLVNTKHAPSSENSAIELLEDIHAMIRRGCSNIEIIENLELQTERATDLIDWIRNLPSDQEYRSRDGSTPPSHR